VPPQVNVMGTLIFLLGVLVAVLSSVRARPGRPESPRRPEVQAPVPAQRRG
jgi:hypothetical protein